MLTCGYGAIEVGFPVFATTEAGVSARGRRLRLRRQHDRDRPRPDVRAPPDRGSVAQPAARACRPDLGVGLGAAGAGGALGGSAAVAVVLACPVGVRRRRDDLAARRARRSSTTWPPSSCAAATTPSARSPGTSPATLGSGDDRDPARRRLGGRVDRRRRRWLPARRAGRPASAPVLTPEQDGRVPASAVEVGG